jgi:hypothetical protein
MVHVQCILHTYGYKQTHTHNTYVILIAFLMQQWLPEHAWMLRYTYIVMYVLSGFKQKTVRCGGSNQSPSSD